MNPFAFLARPLKSDTAVARFAPTLIDPTDFKQIVGGVSPRGTW